jgi:hypothetical protein
VTETEDAPGEKKKRKKQRMMGEVVQPTLLVIVTMKIVNDLRMIRNGAGVPRLEDGGEGVGRAVVVVVMITITRHRVVLRWIRIGRDVVGEGDHEGAGVKEGVGAKRAVGAEAGLIAPLMFVTILVNVGLTKVDLNADEVIRGEHAVRGRGDAVVEIDRIARETILLVTFRAARELLLEKIIG